MRAKLLTAASLVLISLWLPRPARAEPPPPEPQGELDALETLLDQPVVTTASRAAEQVQTAPSAMFTITAEDIRTYGIRSIDEALDLLGVGMRVDKARDYYTGVDVGVQGLMLRDYGRHLLVLLDGHVMNSQANGEITLHEGLGVPLEAIDHIEVMLGAGSVMYGSNAMTAVVHVVTKSAQRERGAHGVAELSVAPPSAVDGYARRPDGEHGMGYQYRLGVGAAHTFSVGRLPASFSLRAEWQENLSHDYAVAKSTGEDFELRPGETSWGGVASHRMRAPSAVLGLSLGDFTLRAQGSHYSRTIPLIALFDDQSAEELRSSARFDLSHAKQLNHLLHLNSRAYGDYMHQSESSTWINPWWCLPGQIDGCAFTSRHVSRWLGLEQQLRIEPRADGSLSTTLGYDVRLRDGSGRPADYRDLVNGEYPYATHLPYYKSTSVLGSVFLQQLYRPVNWFTLNVGARLDVDSLFGTHLSPRAALVFVPHHTASIRASYAEAFRGPSAAELYATDPTYVIRPDSLGAEVVRTAELEWQQRVSFVSFSLRGYVAFYRDFIAQRSATPDETSRAFERNELASSVDPTWVVINDNIDRIRSYGGTVTLQARPVRGLSVAGSVTVSRDHSEEISDVLWPRSFGNFRLAYEFRPDGPSLSLATSFAHKRNAFNSAANTENNTVIKVRDTFDLRLTLSSPIRGVAGLRVRAGGGVRVFPDAPYLLTGGSGTGERVQYFHDVPQLYLLLGVSYDY
ncbi:MAG TPA: TonB-dependent receptor [Polyangiales bacterium]